MLTNQKLLEWIEDAQRATPFCSYCWSPTTIVERDGALWLECSTLSERRGGLRALLTLDFASRHTKREIATLSAAA